jgi:hypothetical protein
MIWTVLVLGDHSEVQIGRMQGAGANVDMQPARQPSRVV